MPEPTVRGRRVLVTGSAGVIGRELLVRLEAAGAKVLSVDREALPPAERPSVEHLRADLFDMDFEPLARFEPEFVFHLAAAFERSEESAGFSEPNWHDNVVPSHRMAELSARLPGLRVFVFASSYLLYRPDIYQFSEPRESPVYLREDDAVVPRNLCGAAKQYAEAELEFVRATSRPDLRVVHARIFRSYGPGSRDVISRWVRAALAREPIPVFNEKNRFAYVYAGDVADGLLRLAECGQARGPVNLASGRSNSVADVLDALERHLPAVRDLIRRERESRPFEASGAELARLRSLTGWEPETDLYDGIGRVVAHERAAGGRTS
jgi:nucleoside-diphosphate-sugar epimerase